jgi:hypothetical protein
MQASPKASSSCSRAKVFASTDGPWRGRVDLAKVYDYEIVLQMIIFRERNTSYPDMSGTFRSSKRRDRDPWSCLRCRRARKGSGPVHWTFAERKACGDRAGEGCDRESLELNSLSNANSRSSVSAGSSGRRPAANRFVCPGCGGGRAAALKCRAYTYECLDCSRQTSISAGTAVFRRAKLTP